MKLIAHRGNIEGPNPLEENNIVYIEKAISAGYDAEIDFWYFEDNFYLGHDEPQYEVSTTWLTTNKEFLWIHCKNQSALEKLSNSSVDYNYFWHENDRYTLTSGGYIWSYPGQSYSSKFIIVMPENGDVLKFFKNDNIIRMSEYDCHGICSDYVGRIK
jgi:hypothetical protein